MHFNKVCGPAPDVNVVALGDFPRGRWVPLQSVGHRRNRALRHASKLNGGQVGLSGRDLVFFQEAGDKKLENAGGGEKQTIGTTRN